MNEAPPVPSVTLECSRCGETVQVFGALSTIKDPFVCVCCLDPRHRER